MSKKDPLKNFIAGGIGGACKVAVGYPFETIKIRVQTLPKTAISGSYDCFMKTISSEGIPALYKGITVPMAMAVPFSAIFFGGCALGRYVLQDQPNKATFSSNLAIGAMAGGFTSLVASPADRVKSILQVQTGCVKYEGPFEVLVKLFKEGGIKSLYQGVTVTLIKGAMTGALYMAVYDLLKKKLSNNSDAGKLSPWSIIGAGGTAGLVVGLISLPLDVLKSRLQVAPHGKYPKGIRDVFKEIWHQESAMDVSRTLFRGWVPLSCRILPSSAACFMGVEVTLSLFDHLNVNVC